MNKITPLYIIILALFFIIVLLPVLAMFAGSVWVDGRLSLQHYAELAWDERQLGLAKNSLGLALGTTVLSLIIGLPLALIIEKTDIWGQKILRMLYIIPLLIPPYMHAIVWSHLLGNNGIVNRLLMTCLGATSPLLNIYSLPGAVFVMTMAYFPIITLMTMSGLKGIDKCQEEAGWIHGNVIQTILRISLPLATPYIFCGALFVFVFAIINFGVPDILRLRVYPLEIFIQFGALFQEGVAMALSLPLVLLTFLIVYFQKRYMDQRSYVNFGGGYNPAAPYQLGVRRWIFTWFSILVVIVSGAIPIVVLLKMAGPLSTYVRVLQSSIDQLIYSTLMGLAGAACLTILSFLMAFFCFKQKGRIKSLTELSLLFPIAIPSTVFGIGLIYVWNTPMTEILYTSSAIVIIGYIARFLPFTAMICLSSLRQMDPTLEELGTLYSGSHMKLFIHILIPLNRIGILTGFFVGFILSLGDLGTSILVMPPGRSTIPVKIYNLMHYGAESMVAALCLILLSIVGISSLVFLNISRRFRT